MDDPDLPVVDVRNPQMFPLYVRSSGYAASVGFAHPFTGVYALSLGATGGQLGLLTSISNLLLNLFQVPFGNLSDKFGQRKGFIIIGGVLASLLWFPMLFITEPWQLIVILAIQSIFGAMAAPAWLALIADIAPIDKRGELSAIINALASIGTLLATLLSGFLVTLAGGLFGTPYSLPFIAATILGFMASLSLLWAREQPLPKIVAPAIWTPKGVRSIISSIRERPLFTRYISVSLFFHLAMAISWPLFSITLVNRLNASLFEIAIISVITGFFTLIGQTNFGRLADRVGRKTFLLIGRLGLMLIPLVYAISPNIWWIFVISAFSGIMIALINAGATPYLFDVVPDDERGESIAIYNAIMGVGIFVGALFGGLLFDYLQVVVGLATALLICLSISSISRFLAGLNYTRLDEPRQYPATLSGEIKNLISRVQSLGLKKMKTARKMLRNVTSRKRGAKK